MSVALKTPYSLKLGKGDIVWATGGLCKVVETPDLSSNLVNIEFLGEAATNDPWRTRINMKNAGDRMQVVRQSVFGPMSLQGIPDIGVLNPDIPDLLIIHYHMDVSVGGPNVNPNFTFMYHGFDYSVKQDYWVRYEDQNPTGNGMLWTTEMKYSPLSDYFQTRPSGNHA